MTGRNREASEVRTEEETIIQSDSNLVLKIADLLPGDLLLYRGAHLKIHQRKIAEATGSPYTHAAIFLGDGRVAESSFPSGVGTQYVEQSIKGSRCVAVLRSQLGFGGDRPDRLNKFVDAVLEQRRFYNLIAAVNFERESMQYFDSHLEIVRENYGKVNSDEEFAQQSFFCSAFVVACYSVVGLIGPTAQIAYLPSAFSPGSLYQDPSFGWLLGYLVPEGGSVPTDDPVLTQATLWSDLPDCRWWTTV
ncbi:hypothetical protein [Kaistia nematophila]|uniref:Permuted papain-like amidase YaeF/Yiix C92 family enzyme n=1 Tax=Kaistia nematophila TaxID=2994654 RepID=A0A9X3E6H1_9HYPH|nr:hypothetical protein [Kaistia nematophila]MCX5572187.1 hypothetical protein [Kaistia nematophila]